MKPIKKLEGKTVGIVGLGSSWLEYNLAKFKMTSILNG